MKWLIRLYPRAWRERHGAELAALVDDAPTSSLVALDLLAGALDARLHPCLVRGRATSSINASGGKMIDRLLPTNRWLALAVVILILVAIQGPLSVFADWFETFDLEPFLGPGLGGFAIDLLAGAASLAGILIPIYVLIPALERRGYSCSLSWLTTRLRPGARG
jgi:hypothetical protein